MITLLGQIAALVILAWLLGAIGGHRVGRVEGERRGYHRGWQARKMAQYGALYGLPPEQVSSACECGHCKPPVKPKPPTTRLYAPPPPPPDKARKDATARACVVQCEDANCLESGNCMFNGGRWRV